MTAVWIWIGILAGIILWYAIFRWADKRRAAKKRAHDAAWIGEAARRARELDDTNDADLRRRVDDARLREALIEVAKPTGEIPVHRVRVDRGPERRKANLNPKTAFLDRRKSQRRKKGK